MMQSGRPISPIGATLGCRPVAETSLLPDRFALLPGLSGERHRFSEAAVTGLGGKRPGRVVFSPSAIGCPESEAAGTGDNAIRWLMPPHSTTHFNLPNQVIFG